MTKLFNLCNLNNQALVVPPEYGTNEDDTYFASIGDATAKHVSSLSFADRQLWQELIVTKSGNIFRAVPSNNSHDQDPMCLRGRDLEKYLETVKQQAGSKLDKSGLEAITEAFAAEAERREKSEDAYDRAELIPYHMMEQYPGMEKYVDIPTTPRDHLVYMGNVNQLFYDEFPDGHPFADLINMSIRMLNKDTVDSSYATWFCEWLDEQQCPEYIKRHLSRLAEQLGSEMGDPDEHVKAALSAIDDCWRIEYRNTAAARCKRDSVFMLLVHKEREWKNQASEGFNVYASIKSFGQVLFSGFRDKMKGHHWARYHKAKRKHAPRVIARGFDINRCSLRELEAALRVDREGALTIWFARPFESLGQIYHKGYIRSIAFSDNNQADKVVIALEKAYNLDMSNRSLQHLSEVREKLAARQKNNQLGMSHHDWRMVWAYYRILREELVRKVNEQRQERKESGKEV